MNKEYLISNGVDVDKSLELFGDIDIYNDTLKEFLRGVERKVSDLRKCKELSDTHNYAIYAHSLKSDARYLGFTILSEIAFNHEIAGKENNIDFIYNDYNNFIAEIKRIIRVISQYLGVETVNLKTSNVVKSDKMILVVDDSDLVRNFVTKVFDSEYIVKTASDGESAINYINEDLNDRIIGMFLDLNMPNVDGFEVLEYFSKNYLFSKIPVTIITGVESKADIQRVSKYPISDILSKPFNEKTVKMAVEKMLINR